MTHYTPREHGNSWADGTQPWAVFDGDDLIAEDLTERVAARICNAMNSHAALVAVVKRMLAFDIFGIAPAAREALKLAGESIEPTKGG